MPSPLLAVASGGWKMSLLLAVGWLELASLLSHFSEQANVLLNIAALVAIGFGAVRIGQVKRWRDANEANEALLRIRTEELAAKEKQTRQIEQAAAHCTQEATKWQAKYEEAKQYTAQEAVLHFEQALDQHSERVGERHLLLLKQGEATAQALTSITTALHRIEERMSRSA